LKNQRDGGGMNPIEIFWICHAVYFGAADEFGAAAVDDVAEICEFAAAIVISGYAGGAFAAGYAWGEEDFLTYADCGYTFA
jgi:hypothetical protein